MHFMREGRNHVRLELSAGAGTWVLEDRTYSPRVPVLRLAVKLVWAVLAHRLEHLRRGDGWVD